MGASVFFCIIIQNVYVGDIAGGESIQYDWEATWAVYFHTWVSNEEMTKSLQRLLNQEELRAHLQNDEQKPKYHYANCFSENVSNVSEAL